MMKKLLTCALAAAFLSVTAVGCGDTKTEKKVEKKEEKKDPATGVTETKTEKKEEKKTP